MKELLLCWLVPVALYAIVTIGRDALERWRYRDRTAESEREGSRVIARIRARAKDSTNLPGALTLKGESSGRTPGPLLTSEGPTS